MILENTTIKLRALEPEDLSFLYELENDTSIWHISNTLVPYSKWVLKNYLENAHLDIYEAKQLRLVITNASTGAVIGLIDLFDFDPLNSRVGLGIVINKAEDKGKGYGSSALQLVINYVFNYLSIHQIYVNVGVSNEASINLFSKFGFALIGIKKQWNKVGNSYVDEGMYQLINPQNEIK